jgi:hypothetical protein
MDQPVDQRLAAELTARKQERGEEGERKRGQDSHQRDAQA